jgi:hypothetical protein
MLRGRLFAIYGLGVQGVAEPRFAAIKLIAWAKAPQLPMPRSKRDSPAGQGAHTAQNHHKIIRTITR